MNRLLFLFIFLISFSHKSWAVEVDPALVTMCENTNKILGKVGMIVPIYWPYFSPVTPYTGVTHGLLSTTSVITELCDFVIQLSTGNSKSQIFASKQFLNKLTGDRFQEDFNFVDKTFNYMESVYDFDSGERRPGFLESEASNREFNQYVKDTQEYIQSKQMSEYEKRLRNQGYSQDIQQISSLAAQNENLKQALNCPDPSANPKYADLYKSNDIQATQKENESAVEDSKFYKEQLLELGKMMFTGEYQKFSTYQYEVDQMFSQGVYLSDSVGTYTFETYKKNKNYKDSNGHPINDKKVLKREYQIYSVEFHDDLFKNFKKKYEDPWESSVKWAYIKDTSQFGLFAGAGDRVEKSLRKLNYECRESKLMQGYDPNRPDYQITYDKKREDCENNLTMNEEKSKNLLSYYTSNLQTALYKDKKTLAKIWNFESYYLGRHRITTQNKGIGSWTEENAKCSDELSIGDMSILKQKQLSVNNDLKEQIAKNKLKKINRDESRSEQSKKLNEEYNRKSELVNEKTKERMKEQNNSQPITAPRGGIGFSK